MSYPESTVVGGFTRNQVSSGSSLLDGEKQSTVDNTHSVYLDQLMANVKMLPSSIAESVYIGLPKSICEGIAACKIPPWLNVLRSNDDASAQVARPSPISVVQYASESTSEQKTGGYHSDEGSSKERAMGGVESEVSEAKEEFNLGPKPCAVQSEYALTKGQRLAVVRRQKKLVVQPVPDAPATVIVSEHSDATDLSSHRNDGIYSGTKHGFILADNEFFAGREYAERNPVHKPNTPEPEGEPSATKKFSLKSYTPFTKLTQLYQRISGSH